MNCLCLTLIFADKPLLVFGVCACACVHACVCACTMYAMSDIKIGEFLSTKGFHER